MTRRVLLVLGLILVAGSPAFASTGGTDLPWNSALRVIQENLTGPTATVLSALLIAIGGIWWGFTSHERGASRIGQAIVACGLMLQAGNVVTTLGFTGALVGEEVSVDGATDLSDLSVAVEADPARIGASQAGDRRGDSFALAGVPRGPFVFGAADRFSFHLDCPSDPGLLRLTGCACRRGLPEKSRLPRLLPGHSLPAAQAPSYPVLGSDATLRR